MIIAVDFDGILCENKFPDIGEPNCGVIFIIQQLINAGHEVILWTSRVDQELTDAVNWCEKRGLHFCAVNENAPSNIQQYIEKYPNGTRKIFADVYVDDHNLDCQLYLNNGYSKTVFIKHIEDSLKEVLKWKVN